MPSTIHLVSAIDHSQKVPLLKTEIIPAAGQMGNPNINTLDQEKLEPLKAAKET